MTLVVRVQEVEKGAESVLGDDAVRIEYKTPSGKWEKRGATGGADGVRMVMERLTDEIVRRCFDGTIENDPEG